MNKSSCISHSGSAHNYHSYSQHCRYSIGMILVCFVLSSGSILLSLPKISLLVGHWSRDGDWVHSKPCPGLYKQLSEPNTCGFGRMLTMNTKLSHEYLFTKFVAQFTSALASFPGLPHFDLPFVFTVIHGSRRPAKKWGRPGMRLSQPTLSWTVLASSHESWVFPTASFHPICTSVKQD